MNTYTITDINNYLRNLIEKEPNLKNIQVVGEISNFKNHSTGHFYFSLKDENSKINAVMFATYARKVDIKLENGMKVIVTASVGVFVGGGSYQLYVYSIEPVGIGSLYLQYEQLKKQLEIEGLFAMERKKAIPRFPTSIGVISAKEGAAIRDVITTIKRRWPLTKITLIPSLVQGKSAALSVVNCLSKADKMGFDTIIVARGGGSLEDLFAFNEEIVARSVALMKTPVISAIGHETDFTIIDFVADKRAATPTAAAEIATPNILEIRTLFKQMQVRLNNSLTNYLKEKRKEWEILSTSPYLTQIERIYSEKAVFLNMLEQRLKGTKQELFSNLEKKLLNNRQELNHNFEIKLANDKQKLAELVAKLSALNPLEILKRGYGLISKDDQVITSIKQIETQDEIAVALSDGNIIAEVKKKEAK